MKKMLIVLILTVLLCAPALAEGPLGEPLADFTVDTIDGGSFTLSKALRDRDSRPDASTI